MGRHKQKINLNKNTSQEGLTINCFFFKPNKSFWLWPKTQTGLKKKWKMWLMYSKANILLSHLTSNFSKITWTQLFKKKILEI